MKHDGLHRSECIQEILETNVKKEELFDSVNDNKDNTTPEERYSPDTSGSSTIPVLALPEHLTDQTTSAVVFQKLDEKMAIFTLDYPAGTKALLHMDRLWLPGYHDMKESPGFEGMVDKQVRINARRVEGYEEFDYQVCCTLFQSLGSYFYLNISGCICFYGFY